MLASSIKSFNQKSRPSFILTLAEVLLKTREIISPAISKASSTFFFKGVFFPPLGASFAVITAFAPQSIIRLARASGENPAKTTECMAPTLAHANIA